MGKKRDKKPNLVSVTASHTTTYVDAPKSGWHLRREPETPVLEPGPELLRLLNRQIDSANGWSLRMERAANVSESFERIAALRFIHRLNLDHAQQCFRVRSNGERCTRYAIRGCVFCHVHGGHTSPGAMHQMHPFLDEE